MAVAQALNPPCLKPVFLLSRERPCVCAFSVQFGLDVADLCQCAAHVDSVPSQTGLLCVHSARCDGRELQEGTYLFLGHVYPGFKVVPEPLEKSSLRKDS